jgi:ABC-type sugar transport system ATPase subunit
MSRTAGAQLRKGQQTAQELVEQRDREHKAVQLALAGATYETIAKECGYESKSGAWKAVNRMLARVDAENADALRTVEGSRLERLHLAHWPAALRGDVKAGALIVRIMERRSRLLGLDAPLLLDATIRPGINAEIEQLAAELGIATGGIESPTDKPPNG